MENNNSTNVKFTWQEKTILEETQRRIKQFKGDDKSGVMVYLGWPSEMKTLIAKGYYTGYGGRENKRVLNWYNLTDKGKKYFNLINQQ